jgi:hypothetical protein
VYGMSESVMAASTELVTSHQSSTGTVQLTFATRVKVEHAKELITILSDDSDGNSPVVAPPITSPLINIFLLDSSQRSRILLSHLEPHVGHQKSLSVVDSLKRLQALKETHSKVLIMIVLTSRGYSSFHQPLMGMSCLSCLQLTCRVSKPIQSLCMEWTSVMMVMLGMGWIHCDDNFGWVARIYWVVLVYKICKVPPVCIATCGARIYYVFGNTNMTRAPCIWAHPVKVGED